MAESIVRFESRTVIQGPVSEVFERLADLPGYGGWMHRTGLFRRCSLTSEVPVRRGTTYVDSTRMGTFDGEVTEFVPPTRIAFRETLRWFGSPMTQARPEYSLEGDESADGRSPRCRRGALWLDEVHEACRSMDGEPGAEPHPELPEAFPGVRLGRDLTRAGGWRGARIRAHPAITLTP